MCLPNLPFNCARFRVHHRSEGHLRKRPLRSTSRRPCGIHRELPITRLHAPPIRPTPAHLNVKKKSGFARSNYVQICPTHCSSGIGLMCQWELIFYDLLLQEYTNTALDFVLHFHTDGYVIYNLSSPIPYDLHFMRFLTISYVS
jgi:hypothetical protein